MGLWSQLGSAGTVLWRVQAWPAETVALEQGSGPSTGEPAQALSIGIKDLGSWALLPEKCPWAPVPGHAAQWHAGDKYTLGDLSSDNRSQHSACTACAQMDDKARGHDPWETSRLWPPAATAAGEQFPLTTRPGASWSRVPSTLCYISSHLSHPEERMFYGLDMPRVHPPKLQGLTSAPVQTRGPLEGFRIR